jgi:soluble lytic murein transglycosylase-like protein
MALLSTRVRSLGLAALALACPLAHAMERITLNTGATFDCIRHEPVGGKIRLYLEPTAPGADFGYTDVAPAAIALVETVPDPPPPVVSAASRTTLSAVAAKVGAAAEPSVTELRQLLSNAGSTHNIDAELLASVVHAESGGHAHAVSRTGAEGLMQLMPGTATAVGVKDAFVAAENVEGGTRYLDAMLTRYHDNIALALAAYNAGPGAVDKYHGVPPFRETRAYVARVIREFNLRKTRALRAAALNSKPKLIAKGQ